MLFSTTSVYPDSVWESAAHASLYSSQSRQIMVGDIITVKISEQTSALQEATTRTQKNSRMDTNFLSAWDQIANILGNENIRKQHQFQLRGDDEYRGQGSTSRQSRVRAIISAAVTEVVEGGNLFIVGEHKIKVNDEVETIRISGVIRPSDIAPDNSVMSHQLAKAQISIHGSGVVGSKQSPGILTKMFNWLF